MGSIAREKSSGLILKRIKKINRQSLPVILMGDFNSIPNSPPVKEIVTELKAKIKSGEYKIDSQSLAKTMLEDALKEDIS